MYEWERQIQTIVDEIDERIKNRDDDAQKSGAGDVGAGAHEGTGDGGGDNDVDKAIDKLFPATK